MTWLVAGVLLLAAEAPVPGLFLMWLGLAALGTGALTLWLGLRLPAEVAGFAVLAAMSVALGWRLRHPRHRPHEVNAPQAGLVGRSAVALAFNGAEGRVRVGDSDWPARLQGGGSVAAGAALLVAGLDGMTLLVVATGAGAGGAAAR